LEINKSNKFTTEKFTKILIRWSSNLINIYVNFVMSWTARILLLFVMVIYWSFSAYGGFS